MDKVAYNRELNAPEKGCTIRTTFSPLLAPLAFPNHEHAQGKRLRWEGAGAGRGVGQQSENSHIHRLKCREKACFLLDVHAYTKKIPRLLCATSFKVIYHQHNHPRCFIKRTSPAWDGQTSARHPLIGGVAGLTDSCLGTQPSHDFICAGRRRPAGDLAAH